jgi:glutaminyl-tRNA synthetase
MAVLRPLKVILDNYPEDVVEELDAVNNPEDISAGTRKVPFSRTLYIEQDDFREDPPKQFYRLAPGREVRLRYGYIIKCMSATKDPQTGAVTELHCTYDPETKSGSAQEQRKVKATIHWVSASHAATATIRLYHPLLLLAPPQHSAEVDWTGSLNPQSLELLTDCLVEPSLRSSSPGSRFQFERQGYFCMDPESSPEALLFNRTVSLKDTWAKVEKAQQVRPG